VVMIGLYFLLDRGRVISPASSRASAAELERLRSRTISRSEAAD
jgi:hypothetical protein